jgi:prophage tail gpP-like protein
VGPEFVTVSAGGQTWSGFENVDVTAGFNEAARSFRLSIAAQLGGTGTFGTFASGTPVSISSNGDLLVTGYVDRYCPHLAEHSRAMIDVSGRGKGQDAIDCSALHATGNFQNQTVLQIAQALDQFGIGFATDQNLQQIPSYQVTPGETVFRCVEKLCRSQGLVLAGQPDGSIKITKVSGQSNSPLVEGVNCKALSADHNWAGRHSQVIARGQRPVGNGASNLQIEQKVMDPSVNRFRPVLVVIDEDTDSTRAMSRAKWRLAREAGHALKASIEVQGFHDDAGQLWTPGNLTWLESPFLAIQQNMAIERVVYSQSRSGSTAELQLCDPQALGGQGSSGAGGASTNSAWDVGGEE